MKINIKKEKLNRQVGLNLSDSIYNSLLDIAKKNDISMQVLIRFIINDFLERIEDENNKKK